MELLQAPKVIKRPYTVVGANGERREDPYYWLRDDERENPEVLEHLKASSLSQGSIDKVCQVLRTT
jgi:oligopeptidase B